MTAPARLAAVSVALAALGAPQSVRGHALLEPQQLQQALVEISRLQQEGREEGARAEVFCELGARVEALLDLLDRDSTAHGAEDVLGRLVVERLAARGLGVRRPATGAGYEYDQAALRECLARDPAGPRAAGAWFALLARSFRERAGADPARLDGGDPGALARAVEEERSFLRRHPGHERAREVRFFLGVDCVRLAHLRRAPRRAEYRRAGREALEEVRRSYPGTMEARAAEVLLEGTGHTGDGSARPR